MIQSTQLDSTISAVKSAYGEVLQSAKRVLHDFRGTKYRHNYCYPFFSTGAYYVEREDIRTGDYCFMPMPLDDDMRAFVEALRKLDREVRPLFGWDIRAGWPRTDCGNIQVDDTDGWCYLGHEYTAVEDGCHRKYAVMVGVICYGVYKDAFLDEILKSVADNGHPITKPEFREIQGFSR